MPSECDDANHQSEVKQADGEQVFPFEGEQLVDTQTGESPLEPNDDERQADSLGDKPNGSGNIIHYGIEAVPASDVERHPAAEEQQRGNAGNDKQVEVFGQIEETEMDTGILSVVTGGKFTFSFGKVKRATVCFGCIPIP